MKDKLPQISIIILNWNGFQDTIECIKTLKNLTYKNIKIVVVDNGSEGDEYLRIQNVFPDITVLKNKNNLGFTGGNNLGVRYGLDNDSDFILLLNNDTTVEPDFIEPLLETFDKFEKVGITAPKINYYNEPQKIWTEGGKLSRIRGSGFANSDKFEINKKTGYDSKEFVSGCCMLIKKEVFKEVGLFDENYFLYVEDTDLCYRTLQAGYKIFVAHSSKIYHKVSNSTNNKLSFLPLYYVTRNRLYFSKKNFRRTYLLTVIYIFITMLFKSILWMLKNKFVNIRVVKKAFIDFNRNKMGKTNTNEILFDK